MDTSGASMVPGNPSAQGTDPAPPAGPPHTPVGLIAALLVLAMVLCAGLTLQSYALTRAKHYVRHIAAAMLPLTWEGLTLQRAAYADGNILPIYGSSELRCCGSPDLPTQVFQRQPTGFTTFPVGRAGTGDLFFVETFGALGNDLHGKRLVISDSPPWFFGRSGLGPKGYDGNFSPLIAEMFTYDSPLPLPLKQQVAQRMLDYPLSFRGQGLLRLGVQQLANGSPLHRAAFAALQPAGRLVAWAHELSDSWATLRYIQAHPAKVPAPTATGSRPINWNRLAVTATRLEAKQSSADPFGLSNSYMKLMRNHWPVSTARKLFCAGRSNQQGGVVSAGATTGWEQSMLHSKEWTDLQLELSTLSDLGARPLVWSIPLPGTFDNYTAVSRPARALYYQRFQQVTAQAHVPALDFRSHDQDRYFLFDAGAHFSPRGWVFADLALNMFWHGQSMGQTQLALSRLQRAAPSASVGGRGRFCSIPIPQRGGNRHGPRPA